MRVIAGKAKGHQLKALEGDSTRPVTDRVKESIFNIIQFNIEDKTVLDLFAGTGSLGIEALSRGAKKAVFSDENAKAISIIRENLKHTKLNEQASVHCIDYKNFLNTYDKDKFDLIFLDPPYGKGMIEPAIKELKQKNLLHFDAIIVAKSEKNDIINTIADISTKKEAIYGKTKVTVLIYHKESDS